MSQTTKIMEEEKGRIKKLVSNLKVKQKGMEEELSFADDWCRKNNLISFALEE
jgi:hypothetical protein